MLSAFKQLYSLEEPEGDQNVVAQAANLLGVGEFQLFQLAHADWFGTEAETKSLEPIFFRYLMHNQTNPWVRHFARRIIYLANSGTLEANSEYYHRYDAKSMHPHSRRSGVFTILGVIVFFVVFLGLSMLLLHGRIPESLSCLFPPCHWIE